MVLGIQIKKKKKCTLLHPVAWRSAAAEQGLRVGGLLVSCGHYSGLETLKRGGMDGDAVQVIPVGRSLDKEGVSQSLSVRQRGLCRPYSCFLCCHQRC